MVNYWVYRVESGKKVLENVPAKWHDEVKEKLITDGYLKENK